MKFIELHVTNSGLALSINPEAVSKYGIARDSMTKKIEGTVVCTMDGKDVTVNEDYATVKKLLEEI